VSAVARLARVTLLAAARAAVGGAALGVGVAGAQVPAFYEQTYLPARHNWAFRARYAEADRLFNAFDYGHAIIGEVLVGAPEAPPAALEDAQFDFITRRLLVRPPGLPLDEGAIAPTYVKLVPEVVAMFEWAHMLHRQLYDVWADERIPPAEKDARVAEVVRYYKSRPDLAFSSRPKSMALMERQYYSRAFRERYPKFNGLIWAYHWMQMGIYDALVDAADVSGRRTNVSAVVARFRALLVDAPSRMPREMPMAPAVAPRFAERYPEAAIIFDNLHALHDVVSDVLASPAVPRNRKRATILRAAAQYRDSTSYVTTVDEWRQMSAAMGVERMGGVALPR
jgi:hypothetical protein